MSDKMRRTAPLNITFSSGEQPTASKLSAVAQQARSGLQIIEKSIGDPWGQSGDTWLATFPVQIPNLARIIGQTKYLNPALYWVVGASSNHTNVDKFVFVESVGERYEGQNTGYLRFRPGTITSAAPFTTIQSSQYALTAAGDYYIDSNTGQFWTYSTIGASDTVTYLVDPDTFGQADYVLPGVIPDPRQGSFTSCRVVLSGGKYFLLLPPRQPLTLGTAETPANYPNATEVTANKDTSIPAAPAGNYKLWQSAAVDALADEHYRYSLPYEIKSQWIDKSTGTELPAGFLYLFNTETNTILENIVFKKPSAPYEGVAYVLEISSSTVDLSVYSNLSTGETEADYTATKLALITTGNSLSKSYWELASKFYLHDHDQDGEWSKPISHAKLENTDPPSTSYSGHSARYPTDAPVWLRSRWSGDDHVSLLSRLGSRGVSTYHRDPNDNAMLGDLVLASSYDSGSGNFLNTSGDSRKLIFHTSAGSPVQMYAPSGGGKLTFANATIGINDTSPSASLTVTRTGGTQDILDLYGEGSAPTYCFTNYRISSGQNEIKIRKATGTRAAPAAIGTNDKIGQITFQSYLTGWKDAAAIKAVNTVASGSWAGADLYFQTTNVSVLTTRMFIKTSGEVGIGTTNPQNKLDIEGAVVIGASYSGTETAPTNGLLVEGNVGIGKTTAAEALDVQGNVVVSGTITATGGIVGGSVTLPVNLLAGYAVESGAGATPQPQGSSGRLGIAGAGSATVLDFKLNLPRAGTITSASIRWAGDVSHECNVWIRKMPWNGLTSQTATIMASKSGPLDLISANGGAGTTTALTVVGGAASTWNEDDVVFMQVSQADTVSTLWLLGAQITVTVSDTRSPKV